MTTDIYKTPDAEIHVPQQNDAGYYVVSGKKFITLSILTMGFYIIYWFDRQWRTIKVRDGLSIWPIPRAIFAIFFTHALYRTFDETLKNKNISHNWQPERLATIYVICALLSGICNQLSRVEVTSLIFSLLTLLILPFFIWSPYQAQMAVNAACDDPGGKSNSRFSTTNIIFMVFCVLAWGLTIFGFYQLLVGL
ncbi:MAG: hypothetical protein ACI8WB_002246 [Phenylobacterium sp.]|jgi:hypothetical protein